MVVQLRFDCVICGSHNSVNEVSNPMGCYAMSTGKQWLMLWWHFTLRNVSNYLPADMAVLSRRLESTFYFIFHYCTGYRILTGHDHE
jgi:hypothetical protein